MLHLMVDLCPACAYSIFLGAIIFDLLVSRKLLDKLVPELLLFFSAFLFAVIEKWKENLWNQGRAKRETGYFYDKLIQFC